jgi:MFS family permease
VPKPSPAPPSLAPPSQAPGSRSALWAVFAFTFINSIGTGVVTNGIVFLTKNGYQFSRTANYLLSVVLGVTYIAGALLAQPAVNWARRTWRGASSRVVLMVLSIAMGLLCALPQVVLWLDADSQSPWPVWVLVVIYSPMSGALWPLVESYVSGGRSGENLRRTVSRWNIVWSSALILAYVGISGLVEKHAALAVMLLGLLHLGGILALGWFASEPAVHKEEEHEPHPPVYRKLLVTFRLLLPLSYIVSSTLGPYLPEVMRTLDVKPSLQTDLAAVWFTARVLMFLIFERWQGWHGRWYTAIVGGGLLMLGFAACVLGDRIATRGEALFILISGLAMYGIGMAVIYSAALYYAMEVGKAEVQAGGKHEALIGAGYTTGPLVGLGASLAVSGGLIRDHSFEPVVLGIVGAIAAGFAGLVIGRVVRHSRAAPE